MKARPRSDCRARVVPGVIACPGLEITPKAGVRWTDSVGTAHDLVEERIWSLEQVADEPLVAALGFATAFAVAELVRAGRLYPVFRKNSRVVRVFACAVPDFLRRRQLAARTLAERQMGAFLKAMPKATGAKGIGPIAVPDGNRNQPSTLAEIGITKKQSAGPGRRSDRMETEPANSTRFGFDCRSRAAVGFRFVR